MKAPRLAGAATIALATPREMRSDGLSGALSSESVAAVNRRKIPIPPGIILVLYALMKEQSIARICVPAMVSGIRAAPGFVLATAWFVGRKPDAERRQNDPARLKSGQPCAKAGPSRRSFCRSGPRWIAAGAATSALTRIVMLLAVPAISPFTVMLPG